MFCFFKQKTAYEMRISDWSSDVCSSDLALEALRNSCHIAAGGGQAARNASPRPRLLASSHPRIRARTPPEPANKIAGLVEGDAPDVRPSVQHGPARAIQSDSGCASCRATGCH